MRSSISFISSAAIVSLASAATLRVDVGLGGLTYTPNVTTAAAGDTVEFHFHPKSHNVVQTSFDAPCNFGAFPNPFYSGFVPVTAGEATTVFRVSINDTKPIWYYCGQVGHCQGGMVGVINPATGGNNLDTFKANAAKATGSTNPTAISGGVLAAVGNSTGGASKSGNAGLPTATGAGSGAPTMTAGAPAGTGAATGSGAGSGTATGGGAPAAAPTSAGETLRAMRWSELFAVGIAVGGMTALLL